MDNIGQHIRDLRIRLGMTQEDLAKAVSTTKQNIYKYESGIITNIPLDRIEHIAQALGTTPAYLMGWREAPTTSNLTPEEARVLAAYRAAEVTYRKVARELLETHPSATPARQTLA